MNENSIDEFELERKEFKVRLKRHSDDDRNHAPILANLTPQHLLSAHHQPVPSAVPHPAPSNPGQAESVSEAPIKSPMIGTFYRAPSPESESYIEVGMEVEPETVVCIIEAMKVMNEIKAETKGVISKVLVDNGKPVEFDQPLFMVKPA